MTEYWIRKDTLDAIAAQTMEMAGKTEPVSTADMIADLTSANRDIRAQSALFCDVKILLDGMIDEATIQFIERTLSGSLTIPGVTTVRANAFNGCEQIHTLILPDVVSIGQNAFNGIGNALTALVLPGKNVCSFGHCFPALTYLYVPAELVEDYQSQTILASAVERIRAVEDYPGITGCDADEQ